MTEEKQIEEMAKVIASVPPIEFPIGSRMQGRHIYTATKIAEHLYNADYRKQKGGRYIADQNYRTLGNCSECGGDVTCLNNYCPNCGAKMKGGAE